MESKTFKGEFYYDSISTEKAEAILAEVIDDLYIEMKENFVDYDNQTHKLGMFKEEIKRRFNLKLMEYVKYR